MLVVLLGPPGAGKGTQAELVIKKYHLLHVATGDILRSAVKERSRLGLKAKEYMDEGKLVPDKVIIGLVRECLQKVDSSTGALLDGFPRTLTQAGELEKVIKDLSLSLTAVIYVNVDKEVLAERLTGRRICRECGATYHLKYNLSKVRNVCDRCGGELYQRDDDTMETVKNRLTVYQEETKPLIGFYKEKEILYTVDGAQEIEEVFEDICSVINKAGKLKES